MHVYYDFKNFVANIYLWCLISNFLSQFKQEKKILSNINFFFFCLFKKKKDFCDVQYWILGEIGGGGGGGGVVDGHVPTVTVWYAMKNLKTHVHLYWS